MITFLSGILRAKTEESAVIDVGGIGYYVHIPLSTYRELPRTGEIVFLHTFLVLREEDVRLFGFASEEEREMFQILLGVNGVGAKMAIDAISHLPVPQLVEAISKEQVSLLCRIPGIGKKRAERLIFDLKNKNHPLFLRAFTTSVVGRTALQSQTAAEAVEALIALGCKPLEAQRAVAEALNVLGETAAMSDLIKEGLRRR